MIFLADENTDRQIVERLRQDGDEVLFVAEMAPGVSDDVVLATANRNIAVLITADKDFGDMVFRQRRAFAGIMLLRLAGLSPDDKAAIISAVIRRYENQLLGAFTVVTPRAIRVRRVAP